MKPALVCLVLLAALAPVRAAGDTGGASGEAQAAAAAIATLIEGWAEAFNAGETGPLCAMFSPRLVARVRGEPVRGFEAMCEQFRQTASDPSTRIAYVPSIEDAIVRDDLAVVTVTWGLQVRRGVISTAFTERTQYTFARSAADRWQVVRLFSYIEPADG